MAIAQDALTTDEAASVSSHTFSHTCAGSNLALFVYIAFLAFSDPPVTTGVTYNGVAMTRIKLSGAGTLNGESGELWGLIAPATGAQDVVISYDKSVTQSDAGALSFTGVDQTTAWDGAVEDHAATGVPSSAVTSATGDLVIDVLGSWLDDGPEPGTGQTKKSDTAPGGDAWGMQSSTEAGAASVTMSWTSGDSDLYTHAACNINAAGGGGGGMAVLRRRIEGD